MPRGNIGSARLQYWQCKVTVLAVQGYSIGSARHNAILIYTSLLSIKKPKVREKISSQTSS